jgi:class 3 adenylate cyclase
MSANQILAPRERHSSHDSRHAHHERARAVQVRSAERKFVTILFADVEGSMGLSGSIGLDEWWDVMDDLFELMCEGVCRFGGWVGAFTGDGIKAIFEAPGTAEEHARRGCQAALWLRDAMPRPAAELRRKRQLELSVRIGLNSGEVLTGTIGNRYSRY